MIIVIIFFQVTSWCIFRWLPTSAGCPFGHRARRSLTKKLRFCKFFSTISCKVDSVLWNLTSRFCECYVYESANSPEVQACHVNRVVNVEFVCTRAFVVCKNRKNFRIVSFFIQKFVCLFLHLELFSRAVSFIFDIRSQLTICLPARFELL